MRPVVPDANHIADALPLTGRKIGVAAHHDGFLIYHPEDPKLLNWLAIYLANNGEKG